jgi:hypothetical protein
MQREWPSRETFYQYLFCEESSVRLIERLVQDGVAQGRLFAVFVSNRIKSVQFWCHGNGCVRWDYHVVAALKQGEEWLIFDHSAPELPFPVPLSRWLKASFGRTVHAKARPVFRAVGASEILRTFTSDRSHMQGSGAVMPEYPPIMRLPEVQTNLMSHFVDMTAPGYGVVSPDLTMILK